MFWPYFFGVSLVVLAFAGPPLAWCWRMRRQCSPLGKWATFLGSLAPGAFLLACFGISEGQQALFVGRMERIDSGWSSSQVELLLGPPDHVFQPGELIQGSRSYGPSNRSVVWSYTHPREHGLLRITRQVPFIRFQSGLDQLRDGLVGGIFGLREGASILQLGDDGKVIRTGSWE